MNPNRQQDLIAYKLKIASQLADALALSPETSPALRKGLNLISETTFSAALDVRNLEPESYELPLWEILAKFGRPNPLVRS